MKRLACLLGCIAVTAAFAQGKSSSQADKTKPAAGDQKAEAKPSAGVSWEGQVVKATGSGAPDMKASNPAQARLGAEKAAQMDALRNLLQQVKGVQISAGKTVGDAMATDEIRGRVEGAVRGFRITGKRYFSDNGVEIDVEVPLAALTEALVQPTGEQIALKTDGAPTNTGLIVDARGLKLTPALSPRLVDESGKPLYGADALSEGARKSAGVAAYVQSLEEAKKSIRVGDKPLVVKAAKVQGSDLVLSADEAKKLSAANNGYLAEGRVVIVTAAAR